jgi:mRNA interferase MazF
MARLAKRGEIWMIDLGLAAKIRPCLILSVPFADNERALVSYVPRTTQQRSGRFEVEHNSPQFKPGAFDTQNIGSVPPARLDRFLATVNDHTLEQVEAALAAWLGMKV